MGSEMCIRDRVNALSKKLEVKIRRGGKEYLATFKSGNKADPLKAIGTVGQRNTGTTLRFWADKKYFDSDKYSIPRLKHVLRAKAVLCSGLRVKLKIEETKEKLEWCYQDGLEDYLTEALDGFTTLPTAPFVGSKKNDKETADWALVWLPEGGDAVQESYVNLVPTAQGGTHVNGLRAGISEAIRDFCEFRNLLPRGVKLLSLIHI